MKKLRGERGQKRRRGRRPPENVVREIFQRWQDGEPIERLRREYNIPSTTLYRELRRLNPRKYRKIVDERQPHHKIPTSRTWKRLENGESTRKIAAAYHMSHGTLRKKLERLDKKRYQMIMSKRGRQHVVPLSEAWSKLEDGETLDKVAQRYSIPPETLRRRLVRADRDKYIAIRRKRVLGSIPSEVLFRKLANGESVTKLAREYGMYFEKLRRRLLQINKELYEEIIERTRTIKSEGYGSQESRKEGADSDFELQVKRILEKHGIKFYSTCLRTGKRRYFPDFITAGNVIIEAAGVTNREYWERYSEKIMNYIRYGYAALIVVPYNLRKRANDYLPHSNRIIIVRVSEFDRDPNRYLRALRSLEKVPQEESFPLKKEYSAELAFSLENSSLSVLPNTPPKGRWERNCLPTS